VPNLGAFRGFEIHGFVPNTFEVCRVNALSPLRMSLEREKLLRYITTTDTASLVFNEFEYIF